MNLFQANKLNPRAFDDDLGHATHDLSDVWAVAAETQSPAVETTHFLIALGRVPNGITRRCLTRRGLTPEQWETGLSGCAIQESGRRLAPMTQGSLHASAVGMLRQAAEKGSQAGLTLISEPLLLWAALQHLTDAVCELCQTADINLQEWCQELESLIAPPVSLPVFSDKKTVVLDSFAPDGRKALRLMRAETEALGYSKSDPRHLLLALLESEGGITQYGIHHQGQVPRKAQEAIMFSLRARAKRTRSNVPLDQDHLQRTLIEILSLAGQLAEQARALRIREAHLLRAFLAVDSTARHLLADQKVDLRELRKTADEYDALADVEQEDEAAMADIATVKARLKQRLVGQDQAIAQILPYIEYMRFGLTTPGHPVGVFLFCGQSGSGKTEMAKELARAVYGSEENLIYLEMGQFNAPESMNIFAGAPPGYIGYGEGKLTNGLRDKPQAVVLFDEVEKAHEKVLDALLRFLDEGKIDDPAGPVRDGSQCIVILTSNVAADRLDEIWERVVDLPDARSEIRRQLREEFKKHKFRIEFLNRVDEVLLFNTLKEADYVEIARRYLDWFLESLRDERMIEVVVGEGVPLAIGNYCAMVNEGARAVPRVARGMVILPVVRYVLQNACTPPVRLRVVADPGATGEPRGLVQRL